VIALSVVISTYNRAAMLADTLGDLAGQSGDTAFEVVVVDDGSTDGTSKLLAGRSDVRVLSQSNQGLAAARNAGASAASGRIVAFLDDDVVVPSGWVSAVVAAFERDDVAAIGGRIDVQFEAAPPRWLTRGFYSLLGEYDLGDDPFPLDPPEFPRGGHCAVRAAVWQELGGLDPSLGWGSAGNLPNEEKDLFLRLAAAGHQSWYWPAARVRHRIEGDRLTKAWFRSRMRRQGAGDVVVESPTDVRRQLGREVVRLGRAGPILARGLVTGRGPFAAVAWCELCAGRIGAQRRLSSG
jgi:glycosyltransferase involved in cell wall biosynthesis